MKTAIVAAAFAAVAGAASACPDYTLWAPEVIEAPSNNERIALSVVAGGSNDLRYCSNLRYSSSTGYAATRPDFSLTGYRPRAGERLTFETTGTCDTTLLVNTGARNWYFDDDDGEGNGARIVLNRPSQGIFDVWVGTYDSRTCDAGLVVSATYGPAPRLTSF